VVKNNNDRYKKMGEILWKIMPDDASSIMAEARIGTGVIESSIEYRDKKGGIKWFDFGYISRDIYDQLDECFMVFFASVKKDDAKNEWNHCLYTLYDNGEFKADFSLDEKWKSEVE